MEKGGGSGMVNNLKWTTVACCEVEQAKYRLEASVFNIEAKAAKETIEKCSFEKVPLWGENGLIKNAFYPGRFKRIYVEKGSGHAMILPSQMSSLKPVATKYISDKTYNSIGNLDLKKGQLLLTRSGTIGNCTIVTDTLEGCVMSDDVIRITFNDEIDLGYVYAFFKTDIGQLILITNNYGSVIQHIEPEHLSEVVIPKPNKELRQSIHDKIMKSFALRDESNKLIDKAEEMLIKALKLPPLDQLKEEYYKSNAGIKNYTVRLNLLDDRIDGSYHLPIVSAIIDQLLDNADEILPLENKRITKKITMAGIFKRVYVGENEGVPFLGGRDIMQLNPDVEKFLSKSYHKKLIENQLALTENLTLITDRGTVGNVIIVPKHFENWAVSQNVLRCFPANNSIAGYLFIWLQTCYAKVLIQREIYGAVIDMIDPDNAYRIAIPLLKDKNKEKEINDLALKANELRSQAYYLEQEAIKQINDEVLYS